MKKIVTLSLASALMATAFLASTQSAHAQSLTTLFATNNNNSTGGGVFFDLNIVSGINITSLETNVSSIIGNPVNLEVWTRTGTAFGFETAATGWTLVSTGSSLANSIDTPTIFDVSDFALAGGVTGVAIRNVDYQASYTNGTGSNQIYSNADLTMSNGSATNTFLVGGTVNTPRVWNGTINYTTGVAAPEPASLSLLALGGVGMLAKRRRKGQ
jgi:hypothetical protein